MEPMALQVLQQQQRVQVVFLEPPVLQVQMVLLVLQPQPQALQVYHGLQDGVALMVPQVQTVPQVQQV